MTFTAARPSYRHPLAGHTRARYSYAVALLTTIVVGCGTADPEKPVRAVQALTGAESRILGFETPTADWSATNGASISVSSTVTQGSAAAAVTPNGYSEVLSAPMGPLTGAASQVAFDVLAPSSLSWGEVRLIVQAPSVGLYWQDLGGQSLAGQSESGYRTLRFSVPENVRTALASATGDLRYRIVLNVPSGSGDYLLDNMVVAQDPSNPPPQPGTSADVELHYSIALPFGLNAENLAVLGLESVALENGVQVVEADGGFAPVANSGSGQLSVGVGTSTGTVTSVGDVFLAEGASVHGSLTTAGAFIHQSAYEIEGEVDTGAPVETELLSRAARLKYASIRDVSLEPGQSWPEPLEPGHYETLTVKENASVTLTAGDYYFRGIWIEAGASLRVDDSAGTVFLYAGETFQFKGALDTESDYPDFLVSYLGYDQAFVSGPFRGSIFAPSGTVNLEAAPGLRHEGTFVGKRVRVAPGVTIVHRPFPWLIRTIDVSRSSICSGETVQISVDAENPNDLEQAPVVSINGGATNSLTEQWLGAPGPRLFAVTATGSDGMIESRTIEVKVLDCGDRPPLPVLVADDDIYDVDTANFTVVNAAEFEDGTEQYVWDFGDGHSLTTPLASVSHDYSSALPRDELSQSFDVSVTVQRPGVPDASTTRTFIIWNSYAISKSRGSIEPRIEPVSPVLVRDGALLRGELRHYNREDDALQYQTMRIDYVPCDGDGVAEYGPFEPIDLMVPAGGVATHRIEVNASDLPADICGISIQYWGALETGEPAQGGVLLTVPGELDQQVSVDEPTRAVLNYVADELLGSATDSISEEQVVRLYRERKIPSSVVESAFFQAASPTQPNDRCDPDNPEAPPHGGYSCQPTTEWAMDTPGWPAESYIANAQKGDAVLVRACNGPIGTLLAALAPPQMYTHMGIMTNNFRQIRHSTGDEDYLEAHSTGVLGEATDGFEEDALRYLWPGTITASVQQAFVSGRPVFDPGGRERKVSGFERHQVRCQGDMNVIHPRVVKPPPEHEDLARPRLHQAADASKNIGGHYRFASYSNAQDTAANDPNGPRAVDRPEGKLYGPVPTVCSQFVRLALKEAGIRVDADRELPRPSDVRRGPPDGIFYYTPGERLSAAKALYAGLYNKVQYELALMEEEADNWWWVAPAAAAAAPFVCSPVCGVVGAAATLEAAHAGQWATDAPDDVANQVTNCFASDYCSEEAKDSKHWKNPGSGFAVSPDDIMNHYDPPDPSAADGGGVYGYHERMVFRGKRYHRVYRWSPSAGTTSVSGTVRRLGAPEPGATVEIRGLGAFATADTGGYFEFDGVFIGNLEVYASKFVENSGTSELWEGVSCYLAGATAGEWIPADCDSFAALSSPPVSDLVVELSSPSEAYRRVVIQGLLDLTDCDCESANERGDRSFYRVCNVGPEEPTASFSVSQDGLCVDEIGVSIEGECRLLDGNRVQITGHARLYEAGGNTCGANEREDSTAFDQIIGPGVSESVYAQNLSNNGRCYGFGVTDCDDTAQWLQFLATNDRAD